ncbi:arabinose efflux permease family protein [Frankia torreyi]|uniref:Arabinose efflux permease family protein n=1 Tax=Frankia torreyi TaxID=1856 RepID=A0A0D8BEC3_9ACTN|nr:arabinose efflux permease family protein [Frankia torreyi]
MRWRGRDDSPAARSRTIRPGGAGWPWVVTPPPPLLGAATAGATAVWQVGILRAAAWTARGLRVPARNALLADLVPATAYGRAYGFERMMDNLGAIVGPLLALGLVAWLGTTWAIGLSVIPGLLAAAAIVYAIRRTARPAARDRAPLRVVVRPLVHGDLGRLLGAVAAFEIGNVAATLLILRATEELTPAHGHDTATTLALGLYVGYNVAATLASVPAGHLADRLGERGPVRVFAVGVAAFAGAYGLLATDITGVALLAAPFLLAGLGIGAVETAQHAAVAALAPTDLRGSAFGLLATVQSLGNLAASTVAGVLWTVVSPTAAFGYLTDWMLLALAGLLTTARHRRGRG